MPITVNESKQDTECIKDNLINLFKARSKEIVNHQIFKFLCVGGIGALLQLFSFSLLFYGLGLNAYYFGQLIATAIAIEAAIISKFFLNNSWTFKERKLCKNQYCEKFIKFNLGSLGSVFVQLFINYFGSLIFGITPLFTVLGLTIDTAIIYQMIGIVVGLFFNFVIYNKVIWPKK